MEERLNVLEELRGTPRPHYMVGEAIYQQDGVKYILRGKINFTSTNEHPSIADRKERYLSHPHVNAGDVCFAVWNGAHIIGDALRYTERTLVNIVEVIPIKIVPPDTVLDLEVTVTEKERKLDRNGRNYELGSIEGRISLNEDLLTTVHADYFARK